MVREHTWEKQYVSEAVKISQLFVIINIFFLSKSIDWKHKQSNGACTAQLPHM